MKSVVLIVCVLAAATRIGSAEPRLISPASFGGKLRVDLQCAEYFATPDRGLHVTIDGAVPPPTGINGVSSVAYSDQGPVEVWEPTDVGYDAPTGRHRVVVEAPDCVTETHDVEVPLLGPAYLTGRLALARSALEGPVGAPNGIGITFGVITGTRPATLDGNAMSLGPATFSAGATSIVGGLFSTSFAHRNFVIALDTKVGGGTASGVARLTSPGPGEPASIGYDQSVVLMGAALRIGARLPLHQVSLEAGSGIGGDVWIVSSSNATAPGGMAPVIDPGGADGDWYVPLWAAMTIKPVCNWGVQLMASYELRPTDTGNSTLALGAGLMWQPSASCSEPVGVQAR